MMGYSEIKRGKKTRKREQGTPMIKWWRLNEEHLKIQLCCLVQQPYKSIFSIREKNAVKVFNLH